LILTLLVLLGARPTWAKSLDTRTVLSGRHGYSSAILLALFSKTVEAGTSLIGANDRHQIAPLKTKSDTGIRHQLVLTYNTNNRNPGGFTNFRLADSPVYQPVAGL